MENKCFRCVTFIIGFTIWGLLAIKNWLLSDKRKQHNFGPKNRIKRGYSVVDLGKRGYIDEGKQEEEICTKQNESNAKKILWWKCKDEKKPCQQRKKDEEKKKKEYDKKVKDEWKQMKEKVREEDTLRSLKENWVEREKKEEKMDLNKKEGNWKPEKEIIKKDTDDVRKEKILWDKLEMLPCLEESKMEQSDKLMKKLEYRKRTIEMLSKQEQKKEGQKRNTDWKEVERNEPKDENKLGRQGEVKEEDEENRKQEMKFHGQLKKNQSIRMQSKEEKGRMMPKVGMGGELEKIESAHKRLDIKDDKPCQKKEGSLGEDMIKLKNKQGKDDISDTVKENVDGELGEFWKVKSGTEIDGEKLVAPAVAETFDKTCIKLADNQSLTNLPGTSFTQCMTQGSSSNSSQASSPHRIEIYYSRPAAQGRSATSSVHTHTEMFPLPYGGVQPISPPLYIYPAYFPYHPLGMVVSHHVPPIVWRTSSPVNHNTSLIPKINAERFPLPLPPYIHPAYFPNHPLGVPPSMVWGTSSSGRHNASLIPTININPTEIEKKKLDIKTEETQCMICKWVTYYDSLQCAILWTEQDLPILFIWHSSVLSNRNSLKEFLVSVDSELEVETTQLKTSVNVLGYEVSHVALITWCSVVPENKDFLVRRAMQSFPILMSSNPLQFTSMGMNHFEESDNREQHVGECTEDFVIGEIVHFSKCVALVRCNITNEKVANVSFTVEDIETGYRRVSGLELELENMFQIYGIIWKCDIKATNPWVCGKIWVTYKTLKVWPNDSQVPLAILNPISKAISCVKCHILTIKESSLVLHSEEKLLFLTWNLCKDVDYMEWKATFAAVQAVVVKLKVCVEFLGHKVQSIAFEVGVADTLTHEDVERTLDTLPWTVWSFFPLKLTHNRYTKAYQHLSFPSSLVSRPVPQTDVSCTQISEGDTRSRANTQDYVHM
ncbi:uncharacterized protein LOC143017819 [Oratosquilla oratoria]|uniref:uncharacterized protein LOC143017819 n=1 Tax=Oratosquilla oratoria TaxID=337810 RepID=UPI003F75CA95